MRKGERGPPLPRHHVVARWLRLRIRLLGHAGVRALLNSSLDREELRR